MTSFVEKRKACQMESEKEIETVFVNGFNLDPYKTPDNNGYVCRVRQPIVINVKIVGTMSKFLGFFDDFLNSCLTFLTLDEIVNFSLLCQLMNRSCVITKTLNKYKRSNPHKINKRVRITKFNDSDELLEKFSTFDL